MAIGGPAQGAGAEFVLVGPSAGPCQYRVPLCES